MKEENSLLRPGRKRHESSKRMCYYVPGTRRMVALAGILLAFLVEANMAECICGNGKRVNLMAMGFEQGLTSPGYPRNYPHNCHCMWLITGNKELVQFKIKDLDIGTSAHSPGCHRDTLTFYDGISKSDRILKASCFTPRLSDEVVFNSTSKYVFVEFRSDLYTSGRGFHIAFQSMGDGCSREVKNLTAVRGERRWVASPHYPSPYPRDCLTAWRIESELDVVEINIEELQLETSANATCIYDSVKIFDGSDYNADLITDLCMLPVTQDKRKFLSRSKNIYILFKSDSNVQMRGFLIFFRAQECTLTSGQFRLPATMSYQTIMSPGYPMHYPPDSYIDWEITSTQGRVRLTVEAVDLEVSSNCSYDSLQIYDRKNSTLQLTRICRISKPYVYVSVSKELSVRFRSDSGVQRSGFRIGYQAEMASSVAEFQENNNGDNGGNGGNGSKGVGVSRNELTIIVVCNLAIVVCLVLIVYVVYRRQLIKRQAIPVAATPRISSRAHQRSDRRPICNDAGDDDKESPIEPPPYSAIAPTHFDEERDNEYSTHGVTLL